MLVTGRHQRPVYVTDTETQREYGDPLQKKIPHLRHIECNKFGRHAYFPGTVAQGILPTFKGVTYPDVIPRFHLPKMPY
ncbi:unnamed protein product [Didymodactylos carnosus]|uniref:Uncharacterized protein n=1 Tax=Didymodactylos carnosus TaxID=1234261 RepID=A0A813QU54_9BILA|nr:unnamed protein product [Didymodactylos carnosus]CAF0771743.1 unnamed protein product [Didymodactylos carnosus]CAF3527543.1 unnamed protein product [Didymodactylos carnosus]CAF3553915.1 unnamed protein product [Didymodactylos carnosus]